MSRISYFQRFSQRENHATNNTLLILRHFYQASPLKLQGVLNSLLEAELEIGLTFAQQIKKENSVPDALIRQEPLSLYIETKRGDKLDTIQIKNHIKSATTRRQEGGPVYLLGITSEPMPLAAIEKMRKEALQKGVLFVAVTFSQILEALQGQCAEYESELTTMVEDYAEYLAEENLLEESKRKLAVFACGTSFAENKRFNLYYQPPSRPCKLNNQFIGIYKQKAVRAVGKVECIAVCKYQKGEIVLLESEKGKFTASHQARAKAVVEETTYYDLKDEEYRFYFVDEFLPIELLKASAEGIYSMRYLDIAQIAHGEFDLRRDYTTQEVAALLDGGSFK